MNVIQLNDFYECDSIDFYECDSIIQFYECDSIKKLAAHRGLKEPTGATNLDKQR